MFGFYTLDVTARNNDNAKLLIFRKHFLFRKKAEAFAESIESVGLELAVTKEELGQYTINTFVTVSDRLNKKYYFIRVDTELKSANDE